MKNPQKTLPINTSDDLMDTLHDVASITMCLSALLQNKPDLDAMQTHDMRPTNGLSLLLSMTADTVSGAADQLEQQRRKQVGHFEFGMSAETKAFASLGMSPYAPMLRAIVRRVQADAKRPSDERLPMDDLLRDLKFDIEMEKADTDRLCEAMNNGVDNDDLPIAANG